MRLTIFILAAAALAFAGCKKSGWVWNQSEPIQVAEEFAPDIPVDAKEIIFVLGVDGMD